MHVENKPLVPLSLTRASLWRTTRLRPRIQTWPRTDVQQDDNHKYNIEKGITMFSKKEFDKTLHHIVDRNFVSDVATLTAFLDAMRMRAVEFAATTRTLAGAPEKGTQTQHKYIFVTTSMTTTTIINTKFQTALRHLKLHFETLTPRHTACNYTPRKQNHLQHDITRLKTTRLQFQG